MGYIGNEPTTGHFPVDNFTSSGGSTYTLTRVPASAGAIEVSVQGVLQPTTAYTVSGTTLTMAGVTSGVKIFVRHLGETLSLPTPADGSVTTTKLAVNSVDGTKIAMGSDARGDILYHGATDYARLAKGSSGQVLTMGANDPAWAAVSGGKILQVVNTRNGGVVSGSTIIPSDDTIPQITEGTEMLTLAITPASTSNKLLVIVEWNGVNNTAASQLLGALFNTDIHSTNAQAVTYCSWGSNAGTLKMSRINMSYYLNAPTTTPTTFRFRVGAHQSSTTYMSAGMGQTGRRYGGVLNNSMTIMEISA